MVLKAKEEEDGGGKMATIDSTFSKWLYSHYCDYVTEMDKNR